MTVKGDQSLTPITYTPRIDLLYSAYGDTTNLSEIIFVNVLPPRQIVEQIALFLTFYDYLWLSLTINKLLVVVLYSKAKRSVIFEDLRVNDIVGFNSAIIAGVVVFLSIGGGSSYFVDGDISQTGILTASTVLPFALSAISVLVTGKINTGMKLALAGFLYLISAVILISLPPLEYDVIHNT